ncbi:MAG TPA: hypothetical protein VF041_10610 [Gemmatimonadaceae bacterium]
MRRTSVSGGEKADRLELGSYIPPAKPAEPQANPAPPAIVVTATDVAGRLHPEQSSKSVRDAAEITEDTTTPPDAARLAAKLHTRALRERGVGAAGSADSSAKEATRGGQHPSIGAKRCRLHLQCARRLGHRLVESDVSRPQGS